ncbi:hypothetical protein [Pseudomonas proteolytica]|uniref:hypothetical protein n=1 Tax=Pseudomonas proteolytica TaxID=219574 RepID=UPI003207F801
MARFLFTRTTSRFDTPGERCLAERLEKKLENYYPCWFNVPVVPKVLTRAIDRLIMTYREPSSFTRKIQESIGSVRQHLA